MSLSDVTIRDFLTGTSLDERIVEILKRSDSPVCVATISYVTKVPSYKVCQVLRKLEKWGAARPVTCTKTTFWSLTER